MIKMILQIFLEVIRHCPDYRHQEPEAKADLDLNILLEMTLLQFDISEHYFLQSFSIWKIMISSSIVFCGGAKRNIRARVMNCTKAIGDSINSTNKQTVSLKI